jgi:hypothetical protein
VAAASLLSVGGLAAVSEGAGRVSALLPLASALVCHLRLAGYAPLPYAAEWSPRTGWSLRMAGETVPVVLCPGSWFGRSLALASFRSRGSGRGNAGGANRVRHADDRRWLVPLRRPRRGGAADWRRLRVLWRTRRAALVGNWSNC